MTKNTNIHPREPSLSLPCPECTGELALNLQIFSDKVHELRMYPSLIDTERICTVVGPKIEEDQNTMFIVVCPTCTYVEYHENYADMDDFIKAAFKNIGLGVCEDIISKEKSDDEQKNIITKSFLIRRKQVPTC